MKLLVMSDSHGTISYMKEIIKTERPDIAIHLGDGIGDVERLNELFPNLRLFFVKGNNDWYGESLEAVFSTDFGKIYMCHGHKLGVKAGLENLVYTAKDKGCSIALYGHTHRANLEVIDGVTVVNPGSVMMLGSHAVCIDGKWELKTIL